MTVSSLGDLAQTFILRRANIQTRSNMERVSAELTSGRTTDPTRSLGGDSRQSSAVARQITLLDAYENTSANLSLQGDVMDHAAEQISNRLEAIKKSVLSLPSELKSSDQKSIATAAKAAFEATVSALNVQVGGRSSFAGTKTHSPALDEGSSILAAIRTKVAAVTSAADLESTIDEFFEAGGEFETNHYLGAAKSLDPVAIGPHDRAQFDLRADDAAFRPAMAELAKLAMLGSNIAGLDVDEGSTVVADAPGRLLTAGDDVLDARARIGVVQEQVGLARTASAAERHVLEMSQSDMLGIDQYEHASRLEEMGQQLELLYTLTARLSRLSLTEFLR